MRPVHVGVVLVALAIVRCTDPLPATAQSTDGDRTQRAGPAARDTESGSYVEMQALLEKTIFKVDVLILTVRLFQAQADSIIALASSREYSDTLADRIAELATHAQDAWAEIVFKRGVNVGQFLDGIESNMQKALDARIITPDDYELIAAGLPRWFAFLDRTGIKKGDRIEYRIRGDSLRTQYWEVRGELLLDQVDVGPERRLAVLGSYFAPKSEFRRNLVSSLFRRK